MIVQLIKAVDQLEHYFASVYEPNTRYFVYAITEADNKKGYVVCEEDTTLPHDIPAEYFNILDANIPNEWVSNTYDAYGLEVHINSFPEWANDKYFYDKLMNREQETIEIFKKYMRLYKIEQ